MKCSTPSFFFQASIVKFTKLSVRPSDAYLALERLEKYRENLNRAEDRELKEALDRAISAIRSRLFQALLGKDRGMTETPLSPFPFTHNF